ncbi:MAG: hypothetical protein ACWA40_11230 [Planktomarina sp.]
MPLVKALENRPDVLAPEDHAALADSVVTAKGAGPASSSGKATLLGGLRNVFVAVARSIMVNGVKAAVGGVVGNAVYDFLIAHYKDIFAFLRALNPKDTEWFQWAIEQIKFWIQNSDNQ